MVIMYDNFTIYWHISLQTEIALSTSEAEYIALSYALREVPPLMYIIEEINEWFPLHIPKLKFGYKVHKDNQYCIKMATGFFSPMTKQIALKYHHFRTHVKYGWVEIQYRQTNEKLADILTKPLSN